MAKQKGFIRLKGSLGGLTFYEKDGTGLVRTTGGVDKDRVLRDPAFRRTRENMQEFGASAKVGKSFRLGFANVIKAMGDSTITGRVTGLMKKVNSVGPGDRGERGFEIVNQKAIIEGFEFNMKTPLGAIFFAPFAPPVLDANRAVATLTVPNFNTDNYLNAPYGATHFKLVLAVAVLSDFEFVNQGRSFEPVNPAENETNALALSAEIRLGGLVGADTVLTADLGLGAAVPATAGVLAAVGIIFSQEINGQYYDLASDNAMKIVLVG